jgi:predicted molibdopterin-dependent oxidoreductase YjgC
MDEFITVCPRNCYSTCSFKVQVGNNKIRRILPCKENPATPEGPCIKGLSYPERAHFNIDTLITKQINSDINEKKRG